MDDDSLRQAVYDWVNSNDYALLEYGNIEYAVVDIQGKTILKDYATITKGLNKIEIKNNLKSGLYFIEFANDYFKFVVQ